MKAIRIVAPGGLDRLALVDLDDPGEPGIGAIRVRLHATSLNFHDYLVVSGKSEVADGRIPMSDGAGIVEAVGEGVSEFRPGDHVVSCFFPLWQDGPAALDDFANTPPATALMAMPGKWSCARRTGSLMRRKAIVTPKRRASPRRV